MQQPPEPGTNIPPLEHSDIPRTVDTPSEEAKTRGTSPQPTDEVLWKERLYPNVGVWIIVVGLAFVPAVIFAPIDTTIGVVSSVIALIILVVLLVTSTPTILVTRTVLRVGRAHIDRTYVGTAKAFTRDAATEQRGTALHGLTYLCIRGWIDAVVKIEITDPEDPAPYWLVSSRHPHEFAELLSAPPLTATEPGVGSGSRP